MEAGGDGTSPGEGDHEGDPIVLADPVIKKIEDGGGQAKYPTTAADLILEDDSAPDEGERIDGKPRKKARKPARARRNDDRRRGGLVVDDDDGVSGRLRTEDLLTAAPGENGRDPVGAGTRANPLQEIPMGILGKAYDEAIGTDAAVAAQKAGTLSLLKGMMMDRNEGGFSDALAQALAEPNGEIRKKLVEAAVREAAEVFRADENNAVAVQLLIEHMTSQTSTPVSAGKI